jgi:hypothetical protein
MSKLPFLFFSFSFLYFLFPFFPPPLLIRSPHTVCCLSIRDVRSRPPNSHRRRRLRLAYASTASAPPDSADATGAGSPPPTRLRLRRGLLPPSASTAEIRSALRLRRRHRPRRRLLPSSVCASAGASCPGPPRPASVRASAPRPPPPPPPPSCRRSLRQPRTPPEGQRWEKEGGAGWSHEIVAPPPLRKPRGAPGVAPHLEPLQNQPFGRAPPGAARGAGAEALPNRPQVAAYT